MIYRNVELPRPDPHQLMQGELKDAIQLLCKVAVILVVLGLALDRLVFWMAPHTPIRWETGLADTLSLGNTLGADKTAQTHAELISYLQTRSDRITQTMQLDPDVRVHVHYIDKDTVNAFASLGGHVFIYRGMLQKIRYTEELDAVLAHEIGHVHHRHVTQQVSRSLAMVGGLSLMGITSSSLYRWILRDAVEIAMLSRSRNAEEEADTFAVNASLALYNHAQGLVNLFEILATAEAGLPVPTWLHSHPDTQSRSAMALNNANPAGESVTLTPLVLPQAL